MFVLPIYYYFLKFYFFRTMIVTDNKYDDNLEYLGCFDG